MREVQYRHALQRAPLASEQVLGWLVPLCRTVVDLHSRGQAHGDIRPETVFANGRLLPATSTTASLQDDIYAMGLLFYEGLTGRLPHGWPTAAITPPGLDQIVGRLLCPDLRDRYVSVDSLLEDLALDWNEDHFVAAANRTRPRPAQPALVGRAPEMRRLQEWLSGGRGTFTLSGPAGSGKSRLLDEAARYAQAIGLSHWRPVYGVPREQQALLIVDESDPQELDLTGQPMVLLASGQPAPGPGVHLQPLDGPAVHHLMRSMGGPLPAELAANVHQRAQGNPWLATILSYHWWSHGHLEGVDWPPQACQILRARLDPMSPAGKMLLGAAALQGRHFRREWLPLHQVADLQLAEQLGILQGGHFSDDVFLSWSRQLVPQPLRRQLHEQLAQRWIGEKPEAVAEVARHLWEAGLAEQALPWLEQAVVQAQDSGNLAAAADFAEKAATLSPTYWRVAGELQRLRGQWAPAEEHFQRALQGAQTRLERAEVLGKLGETFWRSGDLSAARTRLLEALSLLGIRPPASAWATGLAALHEVARMLLPAPRAHRPISAEQILAVRLLDQLSYVIVYSDGLGLIWSSLRAVRLAQSALPSHQLGMALATHAVSLLFVPRLLSRGLRLGQRAVDLLEPGGQTHDLASARARLASLHLFSGQLERAWELGSQALAWLEHHGDRYDVGLCRYNLALCAYWQGLHSEAARRGRRAWRQALQADDRMAALYTARVLALMGEVAEDFEVEFEQPSEHPHVEMLRQELLGLMHLARRHPSLARAHLQVALTRAHKLKAIIDVAFHSLALARACREMAETAPLAERRALYLEAGKLAANITRLPMYGSFQPQAWRELGWSQLGLGREGSARKCFERSLAWARRQGQLQEVHGSESDRVRSGLQPGRVVQAFQGHQRASDRLEQILFHGRALLRARSREEVDQLTQQAAFVLLGARECWASPDRVEAPHLLRHPGLGSELVFPAGGERSYHCRNRYLSDLFGAQELRLAAFLGTLAGVADENAQLLEQILLHDTQLTQLIENVPLGLATLDEHGAICAANVTLCNMLGSDLVGKNLAECVYREDRKDFVAQLTALQCGQASAFHSETRYLGRSHNLIWAEVRAVRLDRVRVVVTLGDLSSQRLVQVSAFQEQERRLLGIEVHDVSQPLVGLSYQLQAQGLTQSAEVARQLLEALRNMMFDLRTPSLDSLPLRVSLTDFMQEVTLGSGLQSRLELDPDLDQVSGLPALFAYRIVVEGMSNVRRHAQATHVRLRLRLAHGQLRASLWDDGVGRQDPSPGRRRHGLEGIGARAELLGGWARLRRSAVGGTLLHFRLPLDEP